MKHQVLTAMLEARAVHSEVSASGVRHVISLVVKLLIIYYFYFLLITIFILTSYGFCDKSRSIRINFDYLYY